MSTIHIRTDATTKKKVQHILKGIGLDLSSAINMYLRQIVITESIPFPIRTVNGFTVEQEQEIIRETEEALKHGKTYDSVDELFEEILRKDWRERNRARLRKRRNSKGT